MDKTFVVNVKYPGGEHEEELVKNITAISYDDAERQAVKLIEKKRDIPRTYFRVRAIRWDQVGASPSLKNQRG